MSFRLKILALFFLSAQFIHAQEPVERIIHYPDSLFETSSYTIYKADTFNVRDENGKIEGKGIWVILDSTVMIGSSYTLIGCFGPKPVYIHREDPTNVHYTITEIFYGQFHDEIKEGTWTCYWENGAKRIELPFNNGHIYGPVAIYYDTGELMYSGNITNEQGRVVLKKFTKGGLQPEEVRLFVSDITDLRF